MSSQELMVDFPYAIVAELDFNCENIIAGKKIGALTVVTICTLFILTSFYLVAFIKRLIFKPMLHLLEAFEDLNRTGRLAISDVGIKGEIKEFVTGIMAIYQKMKISEKNSAITKTTQMLAHDVRKPFSMLISILELLQHCDDPEEIRKMSSEYTPHVKIAITSVDNMLEEILETGRQNKILQKPCCLGSIIKSAIDEVSYAFPNADVELAYHFNHTRLVHADALKIQRVFSNIFGNAVQAMENRGSVWFKTDDSDDKSFVTCRIGNTGSCIQEEDLPHVFDMFYSRNKREGTGLGLAICHNIIIAHGGEIWCESTLQKRIVEFYFTLPAAGNDIDIKKTLLPSNIQNCIASLNREKTEAMSKYSAQITNPYRYKLENKIKDFNVRQNRKLKLGIVDDEPFYRHALKKLIKDSIILRDSIDTFMFANRDDLFNTISRDQLDMIICDIDFGAERCNGFEIVADLRKNGYSLPVCMHSNRSLPKDYENAIGAGAQALLPKPMPKDHLIKFIADTLPEQI